ncbi:hypothetical protein PUR71_00355, partial [Streptomyces sp. SP17BM10]|nr:hypothetical protein [Streptomyces sp. SP17BM10]
RGLRFFGARRDGARLRAGDADGCYGDGADLGEGHYQAHLNLAYRLRGPAGPRPGPGAARITRRAAFPAPSVMAC